MTRFTKSLADRLSDEGILECVSELLIRQYMQPIHTRTKELKKLLCCEATKLFQGATPEGGCDPFFLVLFLCSAPETKIQAAQAQRLIQLSARQQSSGS